MSATPKTKIHWPLAIAIAALLPAYAHGSITLWWVTTAGDQAGGNLVLSRPIEQTQTIVSGSFDAYYHGSDPFNLAGRTWLGGPTFAVDALITGGPYQGDLYLYPSNPYFDTYFGGKWPQAWDFGFDSQYNPDYRMGVGRWVVVVPESAGCFVGALVILPMAAQALRVVRKQREA